MMSQCFVTGCPTVLPTFSPSDFFVEQWVEALPRQDRQFNQHIDSVCSAHFEKKFIIQEPVYILGSSGTKITRTKCSLKPGAVPTVFDFDVTIKDEPLDSPTKGEERRIQTEKVDTPVVELMKRIEMDDVDLLEPKSEKESDDDDGDIATQSERSNTTVKKKLGGPVKRKGRKRKIFTARKARTSLLAKKDSLSTSVLPLSNILSLDNVVNSHEERSPKINKQNEPEVLLIKRKPGRPRKKFLLSPVKKNKNVVTKILKNYERRSSKNKSNVIPSPHLDTETSQLESQSSSLEMTGQISEKIKSSENVIPSSSLPSSRNLKTRQDGEAMVVSELSISQNTSSHDLSTSSSLPPRKSPSSPGNKLLVKRKLEFAQSSGAGNKGVCFVLSCLQQCKKLFPPPKDDLKLFKQWSDKIPKREREFSENDYICADHFADGAIKKKVLTAKGNYFTLPFLRWRLLPGAIPQIFRTPRVTLERINDVTTAILNFRKRKTTSNQENSNVSNSSPVKRRKKESLVAIKGVKSPNESSEIDKTKQECVVPGCLGVKDKSYKKEVYFHEFPLYINYRNLWAREISRKTGVEIPSTMAFLFGKKVCSRHFHSKDYVGNCRTNVLRTSAVPSEFNLIEKDGNELPTQSQDISKEDSSDLEIMYVQTSGSSSSAEKRNSRAESRQGRNKRKNFVSARSVSPESSIDTPVDKTDTVKKTYSKVRSPRKTNQTQVSTNPKNFVKTSVIPNILKTSKAKKSPNSIQPANEPNTNNQSLPIVSPMYLVMADNNNFVGTTTTTPSLSVTSSSNPSNAVLPSPNFYQSLSVLNHSTMAVLNHSTMAPLVGSNVGMPKIIFDTVTTPGGGGHEVSVSPIILDNTHPSSSSGNQKQQKDPKGLPKTGKYVISQKNGKVYVSPYNSMNQPMTTKTIFTPNRGKKSFDCPKDNELFLVVVDNWESKKTTFSCSIDNTRLIVTNEQLVDPTSKLVPTQVSEKVRTVPNSKIVQVSTKPSSTNVTVTTTSKEKSKDGGNVSDANIVDSEYNNAVTEVQNFCGEAQAASTSMPRNNNKKKTVEKPVNIPSKVNHSSPKPALVVPTLFLDSTKHGLGNMMEWLPIIKWADKDTWSMKILSDNKKNEKYLFISELVVRDGNLSLQRILKIKQDFTFEVWANGSEFTFMFNSDGDKIKSYPRLQEILDDMTALNICAGLQGFSFLSENILKGTGKKQGDTWFSEKCCKLSDDQTCSSCLALVEVLIGQKNKMKNSVSNPVPIRPAPTTVSVANTSIAVITTSSCNTVQTPTSQRKISLTTMTQCANATPALNNSLKSTPPIMSTTSPTTVIRPNLSMNNSLKSTPLIMSTTSPTTIIRPNLAMNNNNQAPNSAIRVVAPSKPITPTPAKTNIIIRHNSPIVLQQQKGSVNNNQTTRMPGIGSLVVPKTSVSSPGKTKFVVRQHPPLQQKESGNNKNINSVTAQGHQVNTPLPSIPIQAQTPVLRIPVPAQIPTATTPVPAQTPPPAIIYGSGQPFYGNYSSINYATNTDVQTSCLQQQQQQSQAQTSTQSQSVFGGNATTNAYSFSLAYNTPSSLSNSNNQQTTTIIQQKDSNSSDCVNSQTLQQQQMNQSVFYYQPLQLHPTPDLYSKSIQFASTLPPTTTLGHSSQSSAINASYLNFGNGMLTQSKCVSMNPLQSSIMLSGSQQNYALTTANRATQPSEAAALASSVPSYNVPSTGFPPYYDYSQNQRQ